MFKIVEGDITNLEVDAIVNAANEMMLGGGEVDGAIHRAAGRELYEACLRVPEVRPGVRCPTGEARITPGFRLPSKFVIHTVGPVYRGGAYGEPEKLANCYRNSLALAVENGCKSVAFPAVSTGVYGYPIKEAAEIAVREATAFLKTHNDIEIVFVCFSRATTAIYESLLNKVSNSIIGAIVGDIAGSRFEWHNRKTKRFTLLRAKGESRHPCYFTDDTVMTLAVADAIIKWRENGGGVYDALSAETVMSMQDFGRRYPHSGYGGAFRRWLKDENPQPYNSWGNGSAMRVSACGWAGRTLDEVKAISLAVTEVTHNHPEGIKGAEATAVATFLARTGVTKDEIQDVIIRDYYPLDFTLDEIRPSYEFDVSCQGSVPQALQAFFESTSFEDAIRNAISIGGDSDTIAAICGAVAGAYYGVPDDIREKAETFLSPDLLDTLHKFERMFL